MEGSALGPRPSNLPPLQIPGTRLATDVGLLMLHVPPSSSMIPERTSAELLAVSADGQHPAQFEPVSPSAFSEMTSLTQGSTASESMNSVSAMPATPSSSGSTLDPFAQVVVHDGMLEAGSSSHGPQTRAAVTDEESGTLESLDPSSNRVMRQTTSQRKNPREANVGKDALGIQLRPRP